MQQFDSCYSWGMIFLFSCLFSQRLVIFGPKRSFFYLLIIITQNRNLVIILVIVLHYQIRCNEDQSILFSTFMNYHIRFLIHPYQILYPFRSQVIIIFFLHCFKQNLSHSTFKYHLILYSLMLKLLTRTQLQRITKITTREALNKAIDEQMSKDSRVILLGEEVGQYHGAYKISKGLLEKYGADRVIDTPITQSGFTGLGIGASAIGVKPIVEFMTMNFALQAVDHIINSAAKLHYMSGGQLKCPIVFRGLNGPAAAVAAQHSQCFAAMYGNIPGLITLSPYDSEDCKGLLKSAIRSDHTVVFLENQNLYGQSFEVEDEVLSKDFLVPIGKAKIMRKGSHCTLIGYSRNVHYSLIAAQSLAKQGIECEVINLRSIRPLDRETIVQSVIKTGRAVTVEDGFPMCGVGAEIIASLNESRAYKYLDSPIERVSGVDVPMPYAQKLEQAIVPGPDTIIKAVKKTLRGVRL